MSTTKELLTPDEREQILTRAVSLIREPARWTKGRWACPVYERDEYDRKVRARDDNGRELSQHCIEGAVNQATVDVLGEERAFNLRALRSTRDENENLNGSRMTEMLGLNKIALELYKDKYPGWLQNASGSRYAMALNDFRQTRHATIMKVLRTGLERVRRMKKEGT